MGKREPYELGFDNLAGSAEGRALLWQIFEDAGLFADNFVPGDPYATAYRAGQQSVARPLLAVLMETQPQLFATLIEENAPK